MASRKRPAATLSAPSKRSGASSSSAKTAQQQRALQRAVDAGDAKPKPKRAKPGDAGQAGPRKQPQRMPKQHLAKPGNEHELALQPRFEAPEYVGSGKLRGMSAIVTGADSGIGRAVAVLFAREGADVAVLYLDEHEDAQVTRQHVENEGRRCINIAGYFHMARAALPHLKRGSAIVNSGSETGLFGSKSLLDYSATKGAIHAFTMALASQLQPRGIRVNAVAPGPVWTPLNPADKPAEDVAEFGKQNPMGRPAQPEELSPAYVFLASPITASYINGAILPVMGGPTG
ncbi:SDR family oxidoreductase [uncultured Xanthomonas sp.]|uniref:SDR family oxidoreductase n=1 Tax=uncultured Xanthomonas sp. TaxID=152831 RepID=UPI0025D80667|nr:SDR family oxidoreductase [uncultured Xanthomonas sp.]